MLTDDDRRAHYKPLSHDALVAIVVELLDERDRGTARVGELEAQLTQSETALREILGWFIPSGDDHMYAIRPRRDYTAVTEALPERAAALSPKPKED